MVASKFNDRLFLRYDHIDQSEMEKVAKIVSEKEAWFDTALAANGAPKHLDPPIYVSQIRHEKQVR